MPTYFVDDAGDNSDGSTWAKAYTSIQSLDTAVTIASGDLIYIGADSNCTDAAAALSITGPTSGLPAYIISSTVGSGTTVSYSAGTGNQILATGGAYAVTFNGAFALYGIKVVAGANIVLDGDYDEIIFADSCTFAVGAASQVTGNGAGAQIFLVNCTVSCAADSGAATGTVINIGAGNARLENLTVTNASNRTGAVVGVGAQQGHLQISGGDFSSASNASCEIVTGSVQYGQIYISNVLTKASPTILTTDATRGGHVMVTNTGPADEPSMIAFKDYRGDVLSSTSVYRSGGASVESENVGWLITTSANCGEGAPFYTPWIYGTVDSTGSKTFTVYATCNNSSPTTATLQDDEIWLEVEYLSTADEAQWVLASDHRVITTAAADQTTETTSTWVGLNDASQGFADFRFKLEVPATVNETGQYRARVAVGIPSVTSSSYLYIDPKVTVS